MQQQSYRFVWTHLARLLLEYALVLNSSSFYSSTEPLICSPSIARPLTEFNPYIFTGGEKKLVRRVFQPAPVVIDFEGAGRRGSIQSSRFVDSSSGII